MNNGPRTRRFSWPPREEWPLIVVLLLLIIGVFLFIGYGPGPTATTQPAVPLTSLPLSPQP